MFAAVVFLAMVIGVGVVIAAVFLRLNKGISFRDDRHIGLIFDRQGSFVSYIRPGSETMYISRFYTFEKVPIGNIKINAEFVLDDGIINMDGVIESHIGVLNLLAKSPYGSWRERVERELYLCMMQVVNQFEAEKTEIFAWSNSGTVKEAFVEVVLDDDFFTEMEIVIKDIELSFSFDTVLEENISEDKVNVASD